MNNLIYFIVTNNEILKVVWSVLFISIVLISLFLLMMDKIKKSLHVLCLMPLLLLLLACIHTSETQCCRKISIIPTNETEKSTVFYGIDLEEEDDMITFKKSTGNEIKLNVRSFKNSIINIEIVDSINCE